MIHPKLQALLDLGRISNLPSVVTNVVAAWVLASGSLGLGLVPLIIGAVLFYLAGTTLNDAVDAKFDREYRRERPIPSGVFAPREVWLIGVGYLVTGGLILLFLTRAWPVWVVGLAAAILVYDIVHKKWQGAVFVMGSCRLFLYLLASSAAIGGGGIKPLVLIWALALFLYIVGLTFVARGESTGGGIKHQALLFLAAPAIAALTLLVISGGNIALSICLIAFMVWVGLCLWRLRGSTEAGRIGRFVAGLLAGIPLIDALAVSSSAPLLGICLLLGLPVSLVLQRLSAAT
jgi:4-hydroxybenzoate polyprenyltransferase